MLHVRVSTESVCPQLSLSHSSQHLCVIQWSTYDLSLCPCISLNAAILGTREKQQYWESYNTPQKKAYLGLAVLRWIVTLALSLYLGANGNDLPDMQHIICVVCHWTQWVCCCLLQLMDSKLKSVLICSSNRIVSLISDWSTTVLYNTYQFLNKITIISVDRST